MIDIAVNSLRTVDGAFIPQFIYPRNTAGSHI